jgi:acetyl esterase
MKQEKNVQGLDPYCAAVVQAMKEAGRPQAFEVPVEEARANYRALPIAMGGEEEVLASVEDRVIPSDEGDIPIRIYRADGENLPILVFYHGGGWVIGDLETHDKLCRAITRRTGCMTVAVDYRLAPEHRFPAAVDDSFCALNWVAENAVEIGGDPNRIAVGGDSAGGNLSAVMALLARDAGGPELALQLLIYPATAAERNSPSHLAMPDAPVLSKETMDFFYSSYVGDQDEVAYDFRLAPMEAADHSGLAPAEILVAGFDPLRDEGIAYGEKVKSAGGQANVTNYGGMIHAFTQMAGALPVAHQAIDHCSSALRRAFGLTAP